MCDISTLFMCLCCMRRLHSFLMQTASSSVQGSRRASAVEICSCPVGYAGTSCEVCWGNALQDVYIFSELSLKCSCVFQACIPGFRRVNGHLYNGVCAACHCHGHASQCHEVTGHCLVRSGFSFCFWSLTIACFVFFKFSNHSPANVLEYTLLSLHTFWSGFKLAQFQLN